MQIRWSCLERVSLWGTFPISAIDGTKLICEDVADLVSAYYFHIDLMGEDDLATHLALGGKVTLNNMSRSGIAPGELWPIGGFL